MKAIDRPFTQIINGTTQFVIPVFQRDFSWTELQCEQLWNDVLRVGRADKADMHFIGPVVYVSTGDSSAGFTRWLLIDGQQRLTTLVLMLTALRDHIRDSGWEGGEDDPTAERIEAYFLKNTHEKGDRRYKLVLRRHDRATLRALLDGEEPQAESSERIIECYEFFREQLEEADPAVVWRGIGRLVVVDVTLDAETDDPQLIFESLNSTGLDLSQSDLIRNYVLMRLPEPEQTRLYEHYWSKIEILFRDSERSFDGFARDYVALQTQASRQARADEVYQRFRNHFPELREELGGLEATLEEMLRYARYYAAFSLGTDAPEPFEEPLRHVRKLVDVPALLVMRLFDCHDHRGTLSAADFVEALALLESYVLRRAVVGAQTRGYWQVFASMAYQLRDESPLEDLKVAMARQRPMYAFPSDDDFEQALVESELYRLRVCSHVLERLENHDSKEPSNTSAYSIEHIMPQNEDLNPEWRAMLGPDWRGVRESWLHRLGNLTLTGYNSTYSDHPFSEKKRIEGGFSDSSVRLNRYVREQDEWTAEQMSARGAMLAQRALLVWPALHVDAKLVSDAKHRELRQRAGRRDVGKVRMSVTARHLFELLQELRAEHWPEAIELAESHSVSYHDPHFFLEVLPRKHRILLLFPLDFNEIDDPHDIARDATEYKFFVHASRSGGVYANVGNAEDLEFAMPIIQQAHETAG